MKTKQNDHPGVARARAQTDSGDTGSVLAAGPLVPLEPDAAAREARVLARLRALDLPYRMVRHAPVVSVRESEPLGTVLGGGST